MAEHIEWAEGPTPHGGDYAAVYFRDDRGEPAPKDEATRVEIVEYDDQDEVIMRTYYTLIGEPEPEQGGPCDRRSYLLSY